MIQIKTTLSPIIISTNFYLLLFKYDLTAIIIFLESYLPK